MRVVCSDGNNHNHVGPCVAIYRQQTDDALDIETISEVLSKLVFNSSFKLSQFHN